MKSKSQLTQDHKNLIRRYLLWAYKSTKESFERAERKTTQLTVDEYIYGHFTKSKYVVPQEFKDYIVEKQKDEIKQKYTDADKKNFLPSYLYLKNRLDAVTAAIKYFLGDKELKRFEKLYEEEFTRRILEARDH